MAANYEVLSDFEVATAEEAQSLFMDQAVVKVDTDADLASLPTAVKTAYVLNTGILMARDSANAWKPQGGAAAVAETAPANPQVGQLWVKPSEVLPVPVRGYLQNGTGSVTAAAYAQIPGSSTQAFTVPKATMCMITHSAWVALTATTATDVRSRLAWTGALTGNAFDHTGGWGNIHYIGTPASGAVIYQSVSATYSIVLPAGTTTFKAEAYRTGTPSLSNVNYTTIGITPIAWADEYAAGVA